jgi:hypothetical protein
VFGSILPASGVGVRKPIPQGAGTGTLGVPAAAPPSGNSGAQGVPATRTAAGAEGSFTTTTVTLPVSAQPTTIAVSISAASAQVQVATAGSRVSAGVVMANNPPLILDVTGLPPGTSVAVQTEANAAAVIGIVANYTD